MTKSFFDTPFKNGEPVDRGSADKFYDRPYEPHWYPEGTGKGTRITQEDMTPTEIAAYTHGWDNETDRKEWG